MSNRKGLTICGLILVIGAILSYMIYMFGSNYNEFQRERLLQGNYSEIYVEGVKIDEEDLENLYLDKFIVRFEDGKAFLSYRG